MREELLNEIRERVEMMTKEEYAEFVQSLIDDGILQPTL